MTIYDKPRSPLALETFINVEDPQQKADHEALAEQEELYMLFYDETVTHQLSKGVKNEAREEIKQIVSKADELFAAIPKEKFDFDKVRPVITASDSPRRGARTRRN